MDDLISRQELLRSIERISVKGNVIDDDWVYRFVQEFPSAEPERKKGRWINHRNDNGHNIADCSECGNAIQWFDDDEKPKFCCMCGAEMESEQ